MLVLAGIVLIVIGVITGALRSGSREAKAGAVVIIGPISIIGELEQPGAPCVVAMSADLRLEDDARMLARQALEESGAM